MGKRLLGEGGQGVAAQVQPLSCQRCPYQQSYLFLACCPRPEPFSQISHFQSSLSGAHTAGQAPVHPQVPA